MDNPLERWFYSTGKTVTDSNKQNVTHFQLDGGKLDLTNDYDVFQELYAKYINYKNCIVERKTPVFKFFIDFDVNSTEIVIITKFIISIQDVMENIYGVSPFCIVTSASKPKENYKKGELFFKQGYHLHWPDILVDKETAHNIRKNILINLTTKFGKVDTFYDSWDKIIDRCVYDANGLRLLGSDKCSSSDGIRHYEDRVYEINSVYVGNVYDKQLTDTYISDTLLSIKRTSIRTCVSEITHAINLQKYEETEDEEQTGLRTGFTVVQKDSSESIAIVKFFKNYLTRYKSEDIRTIQKSKDYPVYIIATKSKYCQNKEDFHQNNNIYFKLTPSGFCQKCLSESDGVNGCCREYQSAPILITPGLESALGWKKPKCAEPSIKADGFSMENFLFGMENRITGKEVSTGPTKAKKNKLKTDLVKKI